MEQEIEYIDIEYMEETLINIFKESREGFGSTPKDQEAILNRYDDEWIEDYATEMAYGFNEDMEKYLHQKDHNIPNNLNDIDIQYHSYRTNKHGVHDRKMVNELTARLDGNDQSEQTKSDRKWLVDWFFETFGTFGISYNFENEMSEYLYEHLMSKWTRYRNEYPGAEAFMRFFLDLDTEYQDSLERYIELHYKG